jgi:hypothetical protein
VGGGGGGGGGAHTPVSSLTSLTAPKNMSSYWTAETTNKKTVNQIKMELTKYIYKQSNLVLPCYLSVIYLLGSFCYVYLINKTSGDLPDARTV